MVWFASSSLQVPFQTLTNQLFLSRIIPSLPLQQWSFGVTNHLCSFLFHYPHVLFRWKILFFSDENLDLVIVLLMMQILTLIYLPWWYSYFYCGFVHKICLFMIIWLDAWYVCYYMFWFIIMECSSTHLFVVGEVVSVCVWSQFLFAIRKEDVI